MAKALIATSFTKKTGVACVPTFATTLRRHGGLVADRVPQDVPFQYTLVIESGVESNHRTLALLTPREVVQTWRHALGASGSVGLHTTYSV
jgi:hypothetical protein